MIRILLSLLVVLGLCSCSWAESRLRPAFSPPKPPTGSSPWSGVESPVVISKEVKSDPRSSQEAARQEAVERAHALLISYLRTVNPRCRWTPSIEYVQSKFVPRVTTKEHQQASLPEMSLPTMYVATAELKVSQSAWEEMLTTLRKEETRELQAERLVDARERQWFLAKGLLGLLVLLGVGAGYFRLDDYTKGYYTNWLRVAAVGLIVLTGYGISHLP